MWKSKKVAIIAGILAAVILVGATAGIALAADPVKSPAKTTLLDKVAGILKIDKQKLADAFTQASSELSKERLDTWLKQLVDEKKITQAQADQYKTWWNSRPKNDEYKKWMESRPNIPLPQRPGLKGAPRPQSNLSPMPNQSLGPGPKA